MKKTLAILALTMLCRLLAFADGIDVLTLTGRTRFRCSIIWSLMDETPSRSRIRLTPGSSSRNDVHAGMLVFLYQGIFITFARLEPVRRRRRMDDGRRGLGDGMWLSMGSEDESVVSVGNTMDLLRLGEELRKEILIFIDYGT